VNQKPDFTSVSSTIAQLRETLRDLNDRVLKNVFESRLGRLEAMIDEFLSTSHPQAAVVTVEQLLEMSESARSEILRAAAAQRRKEAAGEDTRRKGAGIDQWPEGYQPSAHDMLKMSFRENDDQLQRFTNTGKRIG